MATLKEDALAYEPKQTRNIAELEAVSVDQEIKLEVRKNSDGEEYSIAIINVAGVEYRVPNSVREQVKQILKEKPELKTFKVSKTGEGLKTTYTVIPLE
jgi:hypothetical protein